MTRPMNARPSRSAHLVIPRDPEEATIHEREEAAEVQKDADQNPDQNLDQTGMVELEALSRVVGE